MKKIPLFMTLILIIVISGCIETQPAEKPEPTEIIFIATNTLDKPIYVDTYFVNTFKLERLLSDGMWEDFSWTSGSCGCICENDNYCTECPVCGVAIQMVNRIESREQIEYIWRGYEYFNAPECSEDKYSYCKLERIAPDGLYRVNLCYSYTYDIIDGAEETEYDGEIYWGVIGDPICIEKEFEVSSENKKIELVIE